MRRISFILIATAVGCNSISPTVPASLDYTNYLTIYSIDTFAIDLANYRTLIEKNNLVAATSLRNAMIHRIRVEIEINYRKFELSLFSSRATFSTISDWTELGLAGATTVVGGDQAKTVMAGILTALKGGRLSVDKNWFRERATEAIISAMQSERSKKLLLITGKMSSGNALQYPFEEAWADLVDYFYAGTLESGIQALAVDAGKTTANAKTDFQNAERQRIAVLSKASLQQIATAEMLTLRLGEIFKKNDLTEAKRIVNELQIPRVDGKTDFEILDDAIKSLTPNDADLSRFAKAFKITP